RRRHTRFSRDWSSDVCSSDLDADVTDFQTIVGRFDAVDGEGDARYASKRALLQVTPPVSIELQPIEAVQIFREWTQRNNVEHLIRLVPTAVAIGAGETRSIPVILTNRADADQEVTVTLSLSTDAVTLDAGEQQVTVPAGEALTVDFMATVPADTAQGTFDIATTLTYGDYALSDAGTLQIVPT